MTLLKPIPEDLKTALGQCFWIGINGTTMEDEDTIRIFSEFLPGGVVLFQRNVESLDQVRKLNDGLQRKSRIPLLLAIDQEGGTVERLHRVIGSVPPAMALAACGSRRLTRRVHRAHARILRSLGFNVNFTPVLDLALRNADNGLGTRCFGNKTETVIRYAKEVMEAHREGGVLTCGKHFPGLGDTDRDSHFHLPVVSRSWKKMTREDLIPYKKLLPDLPFIMVNHALYPGKNEKLPASLSPEVVRKFLLERWNYPGISISDDLIMGAVSNIYNLTAAAEHALHAGNHLFLICKPEGVVKTFRRLLDRGHRDARLRQEIFRSSSRILSFKFRNLSNRPARIPLQRELRRLESSSAQAARNSITSVRGTIPGRISGDCTLFLPESKWISDQATAHECVPKKWKSRFHLRVFSPKWEAQKMQSLASGSTSDWNVVVVNQASHFTGQQNLVKELLRKGKKVAVITGGFPEDVFPEDVKAVLASYWIFPASIQAALEMLFAGRKIKGRSPLE